MCAKLNTAVRLDNGVIFAMYWYFRVVSAINPQTGQPDYSQAWAEYYRQQGMYQQANAILQQHQQQQGGQGGQGGQPQQ